MGKLLERRIASVDERLVLLAPAHDPVPAAFTNVDVDDRRHHELLREMQQLRGSVYLQDGAVARHQLSVDGLHESPDDKDAWHLLMLDKDQRVSACVGYVERKNTTPVDQLRVQECELARQDRWRDLLRKAVQSELTRARRDGVHYAEVGGWAVEERSRCMSEGLVLALAAFSFARICGDAVGITTATVRHGSSSILRRLGGRHLEADGQTLPPYHDPKYGCDMELLRFDSRQSNPKYFGLIEMLRDKLAQVPVIARTASRAESLDLGLARSGIRITLPGPLYQPVELVTVS